jgi:hypothetical protein
MLVDREPRGSELGASFSWSGAVHGAWQERPWLSMWDRSGARLRGFVDISAGRSADTFGTSGRGRG